MIEFMVIAAPRSGTAWAANWLTTDHTLCLHEPLWRRHYREFDVIKSTKMLGVACTGIALFQEFLAAHPARKVILHRDLKEVDASLAAIGMPPVGEVMAGQLERVRGMHVHWLDLFEKPAPIYEYLLQKPFDAERHTALRTFEVQTDFEGIQVDTKVTASLMAELRAIAEGRTP